MIIARGRCTEGARPYFAIKSLRACCCGECTENGRIVLVGWKALILACLNMATRFQVGAKEPDKSAHPTV